MSSGLPPYRDFMVPPSSDRCETCGQPRGGGPVWMLEHPRWEHAACRDWSRRAFPYEWKLNHLRLLVRALKRASALTLRAGVFLNKLRGRWPAGAREGLDELAQLESALDDALRTLRERIDRR